MKIFLSLAIGAMAVGVCSAQVETFAAYVDSDLCARLMLGPITEARVECSQGTAKDGSRPVLVRLSDNAVLSVNKQKLLKPYVGQFVQATGEANDKAGRIKLQGLEPVERSALGTADAASQILNADSDGVDSRVFEQVRHQLAMMPYISEFDFISFTMMGSDVILTGWTVRPSNRRTAYNSIKRIEGVSSITNNIYVLPLSSSDRRIAAAARVRLHQRLSRYFWGRGSAIKIIVNHGNIILLGTVDTEAEANLAYIQCNGIPGVFNVFNMLRTGSS